MATDSTIFVGTGVGDKETSHQIGGEIPDSAPKPLSKELKVFTMLKHQAKEPAGERAMKRKELRPGMSIDRQDAENRKIEMYEALKWIVACVVVLTVVASALAIAFTIKMLQ